MANKVIKGLTVEISGDTTKLGQALDSADKQSRALSGELRQIDKLLQFDSANPEMLAQKQEVLTKQISNTEEKLKLLKAAQEQANEAVKNGETIGDETFRALEREIQFAENALKKYQTAADDTAQKISDVGTNTAETAEAVKPLTETVKAQEAELSKLKADYVDIAAAQGADSEEAKKLLSAIGNLSAELVDNKQKMQAAKQTADQYDSTVAKNVTTTLSLTETVKAQEKELSALKSQYADTAAEQGKDSAEAKALAAQITALSGELAKNKTSLHDAQTAADAFDETVSKTETVTKSLSETVADQQNELKKLRAEYAEIVAVQGADSDEAKRLAGQITALSSDLKANETALKLAEQAAESLGKEEKSLSEITADQKRELSALKEKYADTAAAKGKDSAEAKALARQIEALSGELSENQKRLGQAENEADKFDKTVDDLGDSAKDTAKETGALGETLKSGFTAGAKAAAEALAAVTAASAAAAAGIVKAVGETAEYGDNIDKMSQKLGMSAEAYQEWDAIMQHSGSDIDKMTTAMKKLAEGVESPTDKTAAAFRKLGISMESASKMSQEELFSATITALQKMESGTERTTVASDILGKSAMDLGALLNTSAADTEAMRQQVHALGGVLSDDAVKASAKYQDSLQDMETAVGGVTKKIGASFMPSLTEMMDGMSALFSGNDDGIAEMMDGLDDFVQMIEQTANRISEKAEQYIPAVLPKLFSGLSDMLPRLLGVLSDVLDDVFTALADIVPDMAESLLASIVRIVPSIASVAVPMISALLQTLLSMAPDILRTLMQVSVSVITALGEALPDLLDTLLTDVLPSLITNFFAYLPDVIEALTNAVSAIADRLPDIIQGLVDYLPEIIDTVIYGITQSIPSIIAALGKVFKAVAAAIPALVKALPDVVNMLVGGIADMLPMLLDGITELVDALVSALPDIIQTLCKALPDIITGIVDTLTALLPQLIDCGIRLLTSLIAALPQIIQTICAALPTLIKGIVDGILSAVPQLIQCGITLLTALVSALPEIIKQICAALPQISKSIVSALIDTLPLLIDCGVKLLVALVENLPQIITEIVKALPDIIDGIITALIGMIPQIIECGIKLFVALIENLPAIIAGVVEAVPKIITAIVDGFMERISAIAEVGENIVKGLWEGIKNVGAWIKEKISGFFDGIVDGIKDFFGIESPSKLMRDQIGKNIALGVAEGIEDNGDAVSDAMQDMADTVADTEITPPEIPEFDLPDYTPVRIPVTIEPELDSIEPEFSFDGVQRSLHMTSDQTVIMTVDPEMMAKLDQILGAVQDGKEILLDGDALVGGTAGKYNTAFGEMQVLSERSVT